MNSDDSNSHICDLTKISFCTVIQIKMDHQDVKYKTLKNFNNYLKHAQRDVTAGWDSDDDDGVGEGNTDKTNSFHFYFNTYLPSLILLTSCNCTTV